MTGNRAAPSRSRGTSGTVIDLNGWLLRHGAAGDGAAVAADGVRAGTASPEEFLATWLSLLPDDADPRATAGALLERYRAAERSPPTLYELRLHELLAAVARSGPAGRPHRPRRRRRPNPRRRGEIIPFGRPGE